MIYPTADLNRGETCAMVRPVGQNPFLPQGSRRFGSGNMVPIRPTRTWPAARLRRLDELRRKHLSAKDIAAELGNTSRSAVLGKLYRAGLRSHGRRGPKPLRLTIIEQPEATATAP